MSRIDWDSWQAIVGPCTEQQVRMEAAAEGVTVEQWCREAVREYREACAGIDYDTEEHCAAHEMADEDIVGALVEMIAAEADSEVAS